MEAKVTYLPRDEEAIARERTYWWGSYVNPRAVLYGPDRCGLDRQRALARLGPRIDLSLLIEVGSDEPDDN